MNLLKFSQRNLIQLIKFKRWLFSLAYSERSKSAHDPSLAWSQRQNWLKYCHKAGMTWALWADWNRGLALSRTCLSPTGISWLASAVEDEPYKHQRVPCEYQPWRSYALTRKHNSDQPHSYHWQLLGTESWLTATRCEFFYKQETNLYM